MYNYNKIFTTIQNIIKSVDINNICDNSYVNKKSHGIIPIMDIIRKQKNKNPNNKTFPSNVMWNGAYSDKSNNAPKIQNFDEYLNNKKHTITHQHLSQRTSSKSKKIFWVSFILFLFAIFFAGGFFIYQTNTTINKFTDNAEKHSFVKTFKNFTNSKSYKSLKGFDTGRINILLLGRANSHKAGKDLTDTIMLLSINTKDYTMGLFSIPRDFLINNGKYYVKINSLYQTGLRKNNGAQYIINAVKDISGQDVHYYFILDFEGFKKIIDLLGGINVNVPNHIKDTHYPGPGYTYETFEVYSGLQKFDGATALKYARTRHADIEGDFGRAKRQQQVMQSARNKAFSLGTIINPIKINSILNILGEHVHTNISPSEIEPFIALVKKVDTQNITNFVLDAWKPESLLISAHFYNEHGGISGLRPRSGNYSEIQERAQNLFDLNKIKQRKKEIKKESPTVILLTTKSQNSIALNRIKKLLYSLGFTNITTKFTTDPSIQTIVIDNTQNSKSFSLDELLKKLSAKKEVNPKMKYPDIDFVIVLGNDIIDIYNYSEISQEKLEKDNTKNNKE